MIFSLDNLSLVSRRQDLMRLVPRFARIVELGTFAGAFAAELLAICEPSELHLVDTWNGPIACGDQDGKHVVWRDGEALLACVQDRFRDELRVHTHRGLTVQVLQRFPAGYFDFAYVDADHTEESVLADLRAAARVTKGRIGGHDYCAAFPGVERAVTRFCAETGRRIVALTQDDGCPSYLLSGAL